MADLVRARAGDSTTAILYQDESWTYDEYVQACSQLAAFLLAERRPGPFHVGALLDNVPEFPMWLGAAALSGATLVGINPTRRGAELARDITHTDCQLIVTESRYAELLAGLDLGLAPSRILDVDSAGYRTRLEPYEGAPPPDVEVGEETRYLLLFTSGTTGAPKACICTQGRLARIGGLVAEGYGLTPDDVCYQVMPMFHSNALMAGWGPTLAGGSTTALRRKFSASNFLPDLRRYGATFFNYVGKPLSYILATPEQADDADNTLTRVFGNEAADADIGRFAERFGCSVTDNYGSTEGGLFIVRTSEQPAGSLGMGVGGAAVLDPETGEECLPARFDEHGRLLNADAAIGEMVNREGTSSFEGYYKNDEANEQRTRDGIYWTGDLGYRDEDGWFYFAGRDYDWLRVDGENFAAAPVERILMRHPDVVLASVYAVPAEDVGDDVMVALELRPGWKFDGAEFDTFLAEQSDLGTKSTPRYVRVMDALPVTETKKVLKRQLRNEGWEATDSVWWRPGRKDPLQPFVGAGRE
ncbi:MAG: AMP-binding protein [Acidimicrobiia bacterium]